MFFKLYVLLPAMFLVAAWFFGSKPWKLALVTLAVWYGTAIVMMETWGFSNLGLFFLYFGMMLMGPAVAVWVGIWFSPVVQPTPVDKVVETAKVVYGEYEAMDPDTKAKVQAGAKKAAKFGSAVAADFFRKRGNPTTAKAFRDIGKVL